MPKIFKFDADLAKLLQKQVGPFLAHSVYICYC